jgi:asparagine synthase (glutamine-hydrolysing)
LVRKELYRSALPDYFSFQSFGYPLSPIKGITQIEAGSFLKIRNGSVAKGNYWEIGKQSSSIDLEGKADVQNEVRRLFRNSIQQRLISDVPIGAFLSGGIDSSAVVAMMAEVSSAKPSTFNISFSEKEFDEAPYAELVARKYNTDHHTIKLSKKIFLEALDQALSAVDSPSADGINTYVVSKAIREAGVTVALSGVGGDELFAGYPFFERYRRLYEYKGIFNSTRGLRKMMSSIIDKKDFPRRQRVASMLRADKVSIDRFYPEFRRILTTERISSIIRSDWDHITVLENELAFKKEILDALPALSQVSVADYLGYTQQTLLKDTDQMSMAVSLEVREPFFDHELIDFVLQVPDQIKRPVYPKSLLVESIKPMLPDEIVFRKKQGFLFPWKLWMKKEIYEFCNTRITRMSERDFINGAVLRNYWNRFQKGDPSVNWTELWLFVVLEYWMEKNGIQ